MIGHLFYNIGWMVFLVALVFFYKEKDVPRWRVAHHTVWLVVAAILVIIGVILTFPHLNT
jgi:uncharacterized membrane protein (GlpM family)